MEMVGVFCGSEPGVRPEYLEQARAFGSELARRGAGIVNGLWGDGVCAAVAEAAWKSGGLVRFVTSGQLYERGAADRARGEIYITDSIDHCKALIYRMATCLVILPGGLWALDGMTEAAILSHLKIQKKPIFLINQEGLFQSFIALLDHLAAEGFLSADERSALHVVDDYQEAIDLVFPALGPSVRSAVRGRSLIRSS